MDIQRNHLVTASELNTYPAEKRSRYREVPSHLEEAARAELQGRDEVRVPRSSRGDMAAWAAAERRKDRAAKRRRMARASRRANRG